MKKQTVIIWIIVAVAVVLAILFLSKSINGISAEKATQTAITGETEIKTVPPTNEPSPSVSPAASASPTASPAPTPTKIITGEDQVKYEDDKIEYEYYDVNEDTTKTDTTELDESQTLEYPLSIIAKQLFNQELDQSPLMPNSVQLIGQSLYIDFTSSILNANLGSGGESAMLDEIASIYLNNITGLNSVYISVDGGNYSSGHIEFPMNVPYKSK